MTHFLFLFSELADMILQLNNSFAKFMAVTVTEKANIGEHINDGLNFIRVSKFQSILLEQL
ncbi:MAG: hypothetical protein MJ002_09290 [Paludibacteraceae bacterium]|nr:hypothetical protein [Paludibacteraceae bacterium]